MSYDISFGKDAMKKFPYGSFKRQVIFKVLVIVFALGEQYVSRVTRWTI